MNATPLLSDQRITLRAPEPDDLELLYAWENDTRLWTVGRANAPYSRSQLAEYISNYDADIYSQRQLRMIIVENATSQAIGAIDLYDFDPVNLRAGVGILVDSSHGNSGFASAAICLLERYCSVRLGLHQLWAIVPDDNSACLALFRKAGYVTCGHMKSWIRCGRSYTSALMFQHMLP